MAIRFAPSPTGDLHLGNVRTALLNFLLAQSRGDDFLLRLEDTDTVRSRLEWSQQIEQDLLWLGIRWKQRPYFQSQRLSLYQKYYQTLQERGQTYLCFCSTQDLAFMRKVQRANGQAPRYSGVCRHLTVQQIEEKQAAGIQPTLRFHVPEGQTIHFIDLVRGAQTFTSDAIGDFIIRRADGTPAFFFCNAIDDALMQISHVLRGEDHISNTPRQILLLQALELPIPSYGHISLIVGTDGAPLSKRQGSISVFELRAQGYLASALCNYLSRLGHVYANHAFMNLNQLAVEFSLQNLNKAPAQYDVHQLLYWQKRAVLALDDAAFLDWIGFKVRILVPSSVQIQFIDMMRDNILFPDEALKWASVLFSDSYVRDSTVDDFLKTVNPHLWQIALATLGSQGADYEAVIAALKEQLKLKGIALFKPLRMALTMQESGPELAKIFELLGVQRLIQRLHYCLTLR